MDRPSLYYKHTWGSVSEVSVYAPAVPLLPAVVTNIGNHFELYVGTNNNCYQLINNNIEHFRYRLPLTMYEF